MVSGVDTCATKLQIDACEGKADLDACDDADPSKHCLDGVCVTPCGNGHEDAGEGCDDGNLANGDGCSATCVPETCGTGDVDLVNGEECDEGVAGVSGDGCSSTCRLEKPAWSPLEQRPLAERAEHAMAYFEDAERGIGPQIVMFGGLNGEGILGDTWLWYDDGSGASWHQQFPPRAPTARHGHGMTWDPIRKRVVLFGGNSTAGLRGDTWEWDGEIWTEVTKATLMPTLTNVALAYDPLRDRTVLLGGNGIDGPKTTHYEWDGTSWTSFSTLPAYPPENSHALLAYDDANDELIYCGGPESPATWKYDGTWTDLAQPCPASGSAPSAMAFDPIAQTLVLVQANGNVSEWNGAAWSAKETVGFGVYGTALASDGSNLFMLGGHTTTTWASGNFLVQQWERMTSGTYKFQTQYPLNTNPLRRYSGGIAYDTVRKRAVMFGGVYAGGVLASDIWLFDDDRWHRGAPAGISGRREVAMSYDEARDVVVLFGGTTTSPGAPAQPTSVLAETLEMAPTGTWQLRTFTTKPSARRGAAIAYDAARHQLVLFGGADGTGTRLDDTWTYDGTAWTLVTIPMAMRPSARSDAAMAYDPGRDRIVMFSGSDGAVGYVGDTWEWDGTTWTRVHSDQTSTGGPPARGEASLVYDPLRHRIVLVGGGAVNHDGSHYDDVWEWDGKAWELRYQDARLARVGAFVFFDPLRGGIVSHGGEVSTGAAYSDATWLLRYESLATRETCRFADQDLDGDGKKGCDDPDCEPRCDACGNDMCEPYEDKLICPADCM